MRAAPFQEVELYERHGDTWVPIESHWTRSDALARVYELAACRHGRCAFQVRMFSGRLLAEVGF